MPPSTTFDNNSPSESQIKRRRWRTRKGAKPEPHEPIFSGSRSRLPHQLGQATRKTAPLRRRRAVKEPGRSTPRRAPCGTAGSWRQSHQGQRRERYDEHRSIAGRRQPHGVAERLSLERNGSIVAGDRRLQFGDRLVGSHTEDFHGAGDPVSGTHGRPEIPVDMEKDRPRTGEILSHNGV